MREKQAVCVNEPVIAGWKYRNLPFSESASEYWSMGGSSISTIITALCGLFLLIPQVEGQGLTELDQSLVLAARNGDLAEVQRLINAGASVNVIDESGTTPLHWAAFGGHQRVVKELIAEGALVNVPDKDSFSPLDTAAQKGFAKIVQLLIKAGANLEARDRDGGTALYAAAGKGHIRIVRLLLKAGAEVESRFTQTDDTALLFAAAEGHAEVVKELAENGADIEAENRAGFFAMYQAALGGHANVIKVLLGFGASPDKALRDDAESPLMAAAFGGHVDAIQALIDGEADVNAQNARRKTALHQAPLLFDRTSVAKALVDGGALVNLEDNSANMPLHIAAQFGAKNIVSFLLSVGADPEAVNGDSLTPREIICDCLEFVEFPNSLQCPDKKCDSDEDIAAIREIIDENREDTDTFALDDDDDDDGPDGLPPSAVGLPLVDPAATESRGEGSDRKEGSEGTGGDPDTGNSPVATPTESDFDDIVVLEGGMGAENLGRK